MNAKRSIVTLLIVSLMAALLALALPAAHAKGQVDRIIITGPGLDGLIIADRDVTELLSMASLENFEAGPVEEPAGLGEGYTLERQYETAPGKYQPFDRAIYYPDPGGDLGYVLFEGIINGETAYDGNWYRARPAGDTAMRMLLDGSLPQPYLMLMNASGELHFLDPQTLAEVASVRVTDEPGRLTHMQPQANAAGTFLFFRPKTIEDPTQYHVDLAAQSVCPGDDRTEYQYETLDGRTFSRTLGSYELTISDPRAASDTTIPLSDQEKMWFSASQTYIFGFARQPEGLSLLSVFLLAARPYVETMQYATDAFAGNPGLIRTAWDNYGGAGFFYMTDGLNVVGFPFLTEDLMVESALEYDGRAAVEAGIVQAEALAAHDGKLYLYLDGSAAATPASDVPHGIFVVNAERGTQVAHWHADLLIAAAARSRDHLYLIHTPDGAESVELLQLDITTGEIVDTMALDQDTWTAEIVRLNPALVQALGTQNAALTCP